MGRCHTWGILGKVENVNISQITHFIELNPKKTLSFKGNPFIVVCDAWAKKRLSTMTSFRDTYHFVELVIELV